MPLFEVAILEKPTPKGVEEGAQEQLLFGPVALVAKDQQGAIVAATRRAAMDLEEVDNSRLEVLVRPFVR